MELLFFVIYFVSYSDSYLTRLPFQRYGSWEHIDFCIICLIFQGSHSAKLPREVHLPRNYLRVCVFSVKCTLI